MARSGTGTILRGASGAGSGETTGRQGPSLAPFRKPLWVSRWHASRAEGARELFAGVRACGKAGGHHVKLTCRGCAASSSIEVGCGATWFCPACRARRAAVFAFDLQRKILGLTTAATRAGLTARYRRRSAGGRFGGRLLTLTLPHVGGVAQRIETLNRTWSRFWRLLSDELRGPLQAQPSGVWIEDRERGQTYDGAQREASLWDLVQYLRVMEWTPGADGQGHPHFHVWLFSPYVDREQIETLWRQAFGDVTGREVERVIVDVRSTHGDASDIAAELTKYLVKDWEVGHGGSKQVADEVFAQAYQACDGRRLRQTSSGLAQFAVAVVRSCPGCGHCSERGHWAHVALGHALNVRAVPGTLPECIPPPPDECDLGALEWMARAHADRAHGAWLRSTAGAALSANMRELFG